jgi:hypothetical protein
VATLLAGTASGSTTLGFTFVATTTATNGSDRVSDILDLTTPGLFVLQLAYNESGAQSTAGGESSVFLGWNNGGLFNNAILGNTANSSYANSKFFGSYAAFLGTLTGFTGDLSTIMGAYGVDTVNNTVWAVLNHNSEFTVVPEPSTYAMLFAGLLMLVCVVRRKQANA